VDSTAGSLIEGASVGVLAFGTQGTFRDVSVWVVGGGLGVGRCTGSKEPLG
jgi:hypothetical protein